MSWKQARARRPTQSGLVDRGRLDALSRCLCDRLEVVLAALGVELRQAGRSWSGPCPVHDGDNPHGVRLYPDGDAPGYWMCFTRGCERKYHPTMLGFVRGVLDRRPGGCTFRQAVDWACALLGTTLDAVEYDPADAERCRFVRQSLGRVGEGLTPGPTRAVVRARLLIPSPYFVGRGYPPGLLDRYDVGDCLDPTKPFARRAVVPVYDEDGETAVGFTARAHDPPCDACGGHHRPGPCPGRPPPKWVHTDGLPRAHYFYNWWAARRRIDETGVAVLCEGPGDVLRCVEAGVENAVGMFGNRLADGQQALLEQTAATTVVCVPDAGAAGAEGVEDIGRRLRRLYRVVLKPLPPGRADLGEMRADEVRELLAPLCGGVAS